MNPCINYCLTKFGQEYTEKCDKICDYAKAVKEKNEVIDRVLEIISEEDQNRRNELGVAYDSGSITVADRIRNRVLALKGERG